MIVHVFAVMDAKVGVYSQPFFASTVPLAIRMLGDAVADPKTMLCKYPVDFSLWHLATWDDASGEFTQAKPYQVCTALDVVGAAPGQQQKELFNNA